MWAIWKRTEIFKLRFSGPYAVVREVLLCLTFGLPGTALLLSMLLLWETAQEQETESERGCTISVSITPTNISLPKSMHIPHPAKISQRVFFGGGKKNVVLKELHRSTEKMVTFIT